ncbi:MAG TPA: MFS transporter, partial [Allocoleopsis sp.]
SGSLAGVVGHLLGGYLADTPAYGRKRTLLFAAILAIGAAVILTVNHTFPLLVIANVLLGLSAGCYWTASDATVVDATITEQRQLAFALLVLMDSLGGGAGVWAGDRLMRLLEQTQYLFGLSILPLLLFTSLIALLMDDPEPVDKPTEPLAGFGIALRDRWLLQFVLVNVLFTTYIALVGNVLPLYLTTIVPESWSVASLFTWCYIIVGAVIQLPLVQLLKPMPKVRALMLSMGLWAIGFGLIWLIDWGNSGSGSGTGALLRVIAALIVLSIASTVYKPFAPAIVAELAPASLRGVYLAISYQCWSIGYFIAPILGGWAMDQSAPIARQGWLVTAATTLLGLVLLQWLSQRPISLASHLESDESADSPVTTHVMNANGTHPAASDAAKLL